MKVCLISTHHRRIIDEYFSNAMCPAYLINAVHLEGLDVFPMNNYQFEADNLNFALYSSIQTSFCPTLCLFSLPIESYIPA